MTRAWNRFWFGVDARTHFRVFRAVFASLLLLAYGIRSPSLNLLYSDSGIASREAINEMFAGRPCFYWGPLFESPWSIWMTNAAFLAALLCLAWVRRGRLAAIVAYVLHLMFVHRNPTVLYGVDFVASFYLFFLCLADDRSPSLEKPRDFRAMLGSAAYRLAQIQLCVIYGYAGAKKLRGLSWWSGQALGDALGNPMIARWDLSWAAQYPLVLMGVTYAVLAWEIYFPVLIWNRSLRAPLLALGCAFHLAIALSLNIPLFSAAMVCTYVFFLSPEALREGLSLWDKLSRRVGERVSRVFKAALSSWSA